MVIKMTDLTCLEICKRIAEIEGIDAKIMPYSKKILYAKYDKEGVRTPYNPLTDDALCFQLMIDHGIVVFHRYENDVLICWAEHADGTGQIGKVIHAPAGTDREAVKHCGCLAIIEAHKND